MKQKTIENKQEVDTLPVVVSATGLDWGVSGQQLYWSVDTDAWTVVQSPHRVVYDNKTGTLRIERT